MRSRLKHAAAFILVGHGLVHLLGTVVYLELVTVDELPYKTTLFGGYVNVVATGIRVFAVLCGLAAIGFVASAAGMVTDRDGWRTALLAVTLFSLALTLANWTVASAGIAVNMAILVGLWLEGRR